MAVSQRLAQIIPFPDPNELATHAFRREGIKEELNRAHFKKVKEFQDLEVLGIDKAHNSIVAPFFANKNTLDSTSYARLSTNLPTDACPGIHEVKIVGAKNFDFFMFELHEAASPKRFLNPRELKKISDKRVQALTTFSEMEIDNPDPIKIISTVGSAAQAAEPYQSAQYMRWRIATRGEDSLHPPKFPTLEIFFRGEETFVVFDQYPYPPTQRTYCTNTVSTFGGSKGEAFIASITKAFIDGHPEHVQLALDIGSEFRQVIQEEAQVKLDNDL